MPFQEWAESLRDVKAKDIIDARLTRLWVGNFGTCEPVGGGVFELKIYYGPGYRIYFGQIMKMAILILCGGDKSTQEKDIRTAQLYWQSYKGQRK
ncbi:MAG: type II toxin-antitoxin system RelE/ParE family toxin [Candidatus Omnitrophica bacterium]|nr:type II toxin-antitoxin system RelE/ParE family toxin [Candidatus Omnitrophota bacterium]